jgi:hypothetical protein
MMQTLIGTGHKGAACPSVGLRVMLLTDRADGTTAGRLATYGSHLQIERDFDAAVSGLLEDPLGYDLFVMDCDGFGGADAGVEAIVALIAADARMRVMLVSGDFDEAAYPLGRRSAVCLPSTAPEEGFRVGLDHVLRDRPAVTLM